MRGGFWEKIGLKYEQKISCRSRDKKNYGRSRQLPRVVPGGRRVTAEMTWAPTVTERQNNLISNVSSNTDYSDIWKGKVATELWSSWITAATQMPWRSLHDSSHALGRALRWERLKLGEMWQANDCERAQVWDIEICSLALTRSTVVAQSPPAPSSDAEIHHRASLITLSKSHDTDEFHWRSKKVPKTDVRDRHCQKAPSTSRTITNTTAATFDLRHRRAPSFCMSFASSLFVPQFQSLTHGTRPWALAAPPHTNNFITRPHHEPSSPATNAN